MLSIAQELQQRLEGEIHFDAFTRTLYSTDASIYRIDPLGVVFPRHEADLATVLQLAARERVPLLPRGAGTSLAGQAVGRALVLDCSRHMDAILEVNAEERWVRVQPGVVLDRLNAALRPHGLMFGPDVATSNRACLGGMVGNNSSGARSRVYGVTADCTLEVRVLLADGTQTTLSPIAAAEAQRRAQGSDLAAGLYRELPRLIEAQRGEIRRRFPRIQRNVSGYALHSVEAALAERDTLDLTRLVCGSEGTLAIITEAKLALVPRPKHTVLGVVAFDDFLKALEATVALLQTGPSAIEVVDRLILDLAKSSREYSRERFPVSGDPEALLLVEYQGDTEAEVAAGLDRLEALVRRSFPASECVRAGDAGRQAEIWKVRKAGVGLLLGMKSDRKPIAFVEDTAVEPARLPEYVRRFRQVVERHGTTAGYYGHASVGCLHLRPLIDIGSRDDVARMQAIAVDVVDLVREFGGSMTGEHGDGLVRSGWIERMYGPELLQAFREVKRLFDPHGILNPGKIVDAPPMDADLRLRDARPLEIHTHLSFEREGGLLRAVTQCSGVGVCRKREGVMCPSFVATGDERHSTRGRANALRAVLAGELPPEALTGEDLREALDLCLACKGCKTECPSSVDMAKLKVEFLAQHHARHGTPLRAALLGRIDVLSRLGSLAAPIANPLLQSRPLRALLQRLLGIDARRALPPFARRTLRQRFAAKTPHPPTPSPARGEGELSTGGRHSTMGGEVRLAEGPPSPKPCSTRRAAGEGELYAGGLCTHPTGQAPDRQSPPGFGGVGGAGAGSPSGPGGVRGAGAPLPPFTPSPVHPLTVALFADTFTNHNAPDVGEAAVEVLERLGYRVLVPKRPCCGRAALSQGLVKRARALAQANLERLWPYVEAGVPIVGLEPSCVATVRDEYLDLLADPRAQELAAGILLLEEFLLRQGDAGRLDGVFQRRQEKVWLHGHCHQKALTGTAPALAALRLVPELDVREIDAGCCGMAGAFGYVHYEVSMAVGEDRLFPAIRALPADAILVAEGISCRQQIAQGTGRRAQHLAEVLRDSLAPPSQPGG